ncbi:hypothetical protein C8R43DRAFT_979068 [Mycena crocata]|nr:hypothetical protein C8R43DRAFT_979068 [Mycena crocata]
MMTRLHRVDPGYSSPSLLFALLEPSSSRPRRCPNVDSLYWATQSLRPCQVSWFPYSTNLLARRHLGNSCRWNSSSHLGTLPNPRTRSCERMDFSYHVQILPFRRTEYSEAQKYLDRDTETPAGSNCAVRCQNNFSARTIMNHRFTTCPASGRRGNSGRGFIIMLSPAVLCFADL